MLGREGYVSQSRAKPRAERLRGVRVVRVDQECSSKQGEFECWLRFVVEALPQLCHRRGEYYLIG